MLASLRTAQRLNHQWIRPAAARYGLGGSDSGALLIRARAGTVMCNTLAHGVPYLVGSIVSGRQRPCDVCRLDGGINGRGGGPRPADTATVGLPARGTRDVRTTPGLGMSRAFEGSHRVRNAAGPAPRLTGNMTDPCPFPPPQLRRCQRARAFVALSSFACSAGLARCHQARKASGSPANFSFLSSS